MPTWERTALRLACAKERPSDLFVLQHGLSSFWAPSTAGVTKSLAACGISFPTVFGLSRGVDRRTRDPR